MRFLDRTASIWLAAGIAILLAGMLTIEWTNPYCLSQSDGPSYAAQGLPLPYWMWNGVVSLEHDFVPHIYVLNLVILGLLVYPIARLILDRKIIRREWLRSLVGAAGCLLVLSHLALTMLMISAGFLHPTTSLSHEGYYSYTELRPVRIGYHRSNAPDCTRSHFWFPNGWQPPK